MENTQPTAEQQAVISQLLSAPFPATVGTIAQKLGLAELEAARLLPPEICSFARGVAEDIFDDVWADLCEWEKTTFFVVHGGHVFEIAAKLNPGKRARGFYNVFKGTVGGHLNYGNIEAIAFLTMPFMGRESSCVQFFAKDGSTAFSVYVGRENHLQIPAVREAFLAMREKWTA